MRIVVELCRDAYPQVVLNNLFKLTSLQSNFSAYMLALVNCEPILLTLRKMLEVFLDFRVETIERRTATSCAKLKNAITSPPAGWLDRIRSSPDQTASDTATAASMQDRHGLSDIQADAILQMQRRLTRWRPTRSGLSTRIWLPCRLQGHPRPA